MNDWRGAAYAYDESWHPTAWTARVAAEVVRNHSDDAARPLFLKLSFHRPHSPYDPRARVFDAFAAAARAPAGSCPFSHPNGAPGYAEVCAFPINWTDVLAGPVAGPGSPGGVAGRRGGRGEGGWACWPCSWQ